MSSRLCSPSRRVGSTGSKHEYEKAVAILEARVRSAYIDEPPDMLSFLVSASSFDDVIDNLEFLTRHRPSGPAHRRRGGAGALEDGCGAPRDDRDQATQQAATVSVIAARTDEARAARDRLAADRDRLATVESLKQSALASNGETRADYLHEVEALAAQSAALARADPRSAAGRRHDRQRCRRRPRASSGRATASS